MKRSYSERVRLGIEDAKHSHLFLAAANREGYQKAKIGITFPVHVVVFMLTVNGLVPVRHPQRLARRVVLGEASGGVLRVLKSLLFLFV